jgi:hypothetical protein
MEHKTISRMKVDLYKALSRLQQGPYCMTSGEVQLMEQLAKDTYVQWLLSQEGFFKTHDCQYKNKETEALEEKPDGSN